MAAAGRKSSRRQYSDYRREVVKNRLEAHDEAPISYHSSVPAHVKRPKRSRSFARLFAEFWRLLRGHRKMLMAALGMLSLSTICGLVPLYGTKLVFDNVLGGKPLPAALSHWAHLPSEPGRLLGVICFAMVALTVISVAIGNSARWQATRISKRVSVGAQEDPVRSCGAAAAASGV